ncbi:MAG: transglycosylase SLT domain-containing protein [Acidobacteria bacterium]|nr:transglycosylase SLT domain-containing protein [Acidobacteriota bacterium]
MKSCIWVLALFCAAALPAQEAAPSKAKAAHATTSKSRTAKSKKPAARNSHRHLTPAQRQALAVRARRARRAFVASAELKPMAQQLLEARSPAAYAGVEAWARKHGGTDAGSLAWLVLGYARYTDRDFDKAIGGLQKAQSHAGELSDYAAYFLASSYLAAGQPQPGLEILKAFPSRYADSLFARDAALLYAGALVSAGDPQRALAAVAPYEAEHRADVDLLQARAWLKAGESDKAIALLRNIYFTRPAAPQAGEARAELDRLPAGSVAPPTYAELRGRADALGAAKRYADAASEYRNLLNNAPVAKIPEAQALLAEALYRSNNRSEARKLLERLPESSDEMGARRDYYLLELARSDGDEAGVRAILERMRASTPSSSYYQEALISAANMCLLKKDLAQAGSYYQEAGERFPESRLAPGMHWKAAWLLLRQGKTAEARQSFEEQIRKFPESGEIAPALYWRARLAEDEHDLPRARAYYRKETERYRNYYYADLARTRLEALGQGDVAIDPLLAALPQPAPPHFIDEPAPADNLRLQRANLLENGGMFDFAVRELQLAREEDGGAWVNREIARVYQSAGHYDRALEALKHAVPSYFALDVAALPRSWWEGLFPRPFWADLTRYSQANQLDPFLVASLIRQESEFNPSAISYANAWGLMQVLPSTGGRLARELKIAKFKSDRLLEPSTNLQLGTHFFRSLVDRFGGRVEYALAAYNAGPERVDDWLSSGRFRDPAEFVESIPFTQTREYVQAILRNAMVYRQLYARSLATKSGN